MTDPVEIAYDFYKDRDVEYPRYVNEQFAAGPRTVDIAIADLGDLIAAAFRAGWDHAETYHNINEDISDYTYIIGSDGVQYGPFDRKDAQDRGMFRRRGSKNG